MRVSSKHRLVLTRLGDSPLMSSLREVCDPHLDMMEARHDSSLSAPGYRRVVGVSLSRPSEHPCRRDIPIDIITVIRAFSGCRLGQVIPSF